MVEHIAIIGCGAAGATAAMQARKFDRKVKISVFNTEKYSQYSRCGLPYTISGKVKEFEDLVLMAPENWISIKVDAYLGSSVTAIDHEEHTLSYEGSEGSGTIEYDALIFATGAENADPPIKGLDKERVYGLRTLDDAKALAAEADKAKNVVVIGGGLVGMETAEAFHERGANVTVVEFLPHILLAMVDPDFATIIEDHCKKHGLEILNNTAAQEITGDDSPKKVLVLDRASGEQKEIPADIVVVATGVRPVIGLAESIGVEIGTCDAIVTNDKMMTNLEGVYACGDCSEHVDFVSVKFPGIVGAKVTKLFGLEIASTGMTEELAKRFEIPVTKGSIKGSSKPHYYVGGKDLKVKTYYNKETGKLVGGQLVGLEDAAMRINVLTMGIQQDIDVVELFDFENCYAPAICDTWDPLVQSADAARRRLKR
jgi:NADH oxidase (H2O2-forming)